MNDDGNGYQRRKLDADHDLLVKIHANVETIMTAFIAHAKEDDVRFSEVHKRVNGLSKGVYIGMGIFILANIILVPLLVAYFKGP